MFVFGLWALASPWPPVNTHLEWSWYFDWQPLGHYEDWLIEMDFLGLVCYRITYLRPQAQGYFKLFFLCLFTANILHRDGNWSILPSIDLPKDDSQWFMSEQHRLADDIQIDGILTAFPSWTFRAWIPIQHRSIASIVRPGGRLLQFFGCLPSYAWPL